MSSIAAISGGSCTAPKTESETFLCAIPIVRGLHVLALGLWFGGAAFFNFVAAVPIFDSFKEVVANSPSDRTANVDIVPPGASEEQKKALASALAGSAVGPIFPRYFALQGVCGVIALATAAGWIRNGRRVDRCRFGVVVLALILVAIGQPISNHVSELRPMRFAAEQSVRDSAKVAFDTWHMASLFLAMATTCLAGVALALAAKLPTPKAVAGELDATKRWHRTLGSIE